MVPQSRRARTCRGATSNRHQLFFGDALAFLYFAGTDVAEDVEEGIKLLNQAAEQNNVNTMYALGRYYIDRRGAPQDVEEGIKLVRKAAEQGRVDAQFHLGMCYRSGHEGLPPDEAEAMKWLRRAAEEGHEQAAEQLRQMETGQ